MGVQGNNTMAQPQGYGTGSKSQGMPPPASTVQPYGGPMKPQPSPYQVGYGPLAGQGPAFQQGRAMPMGNAGNGSLQHVFGSQQNMMQPLGQTSMYGPNAQTMPGSMGSKSQGGKGQPMQPPSPLNTFTPQGGQQSVGQYTQLPNAQNPNSTLQTPSNPNQFAQPNWQGNQQISAPTPNPMTPPPGGAINAPGHVGSPQQPPPAAAPAPGSPVNHDQNFWQLYQENPALAFQYTHQRGADQWFQQNQGALQQDPRMGGLQNYQNWVNGSSYGYGAGAGGSPSISQQQFDRLRQLSGNQGLDAWGRPLPGTAK